MDSDLPAGLSRRTINYTEIAYSDEEGDSPNRRRPEPIDVDAANAYDIRVRRPPPAQQGEDVNRDDTSDRLKSVIHPPLPTEEEFKKLARTSELLREVAPKAGYANDLISQQNLLIANLRSKFHQAEKEKQKLETENELLKSIAGVKSKKEFLEEGERMLSRIQNLSKTFRKDYGEFLDMVCNAITMHTGLQNVAPETRRHIQILDLDGQMLSVLYSEIHGYLANHAAQIKAIAEGPDFMRQFVSSFTPDDIENYKFNMIKGRLLRYVGTASINSTANRSPSTEQMIDDYHDIIDLLELLDDHMEEKNAEIGRFVKEKQDLRKEIAELHKTLERATASSQDVTKDDSMDQPK